MIFGEEAQAQAAAFNRTKPWLQEPDYEMFEAAGMKCVIRRGPPEFGHLCGYVGVGRAHPLFEVDRTELVPAPDVWRGQVMRSIDDHGALDIFAAALQDSQQEIPEGFAPLNMLIGVHGGLTGSGRMFDHTGWWFGFDCSHAGDFWPGSVAALEAIEHDVSFMYESTLYRTFDYVRHECATLAQQIADWSEAIPHVEAAKAAIAAARMMRAAQPGSE